MNGYVCFYKSKRIEVYASTSLEARRKAARELKLSAKQEHDISVVLAEKDGASVTHTPDF